MLTPTGGVLTGYKGLMLQSTLPIDGAHADDYDQLFIPGGLAPGELRTNPTAVAFVQAFAQTGKPVAAVCHGPQLLIAVGLVTGRSMTSWHEVAPEIRDAAVLTSMNPL